MANVLAGIGGGRLEIRRGSGRTEGHCAASADGVTCDNLLVVPKIVIPFMTYNVRVVRLTSAKRPNKPLVRRARRVL